MEIIYFHPAPWPDAIDAGIVRYEDEYEDKDNEDFADDGEYPHEPFSPAEVTAISGILRNFILEILNSDTRESIELQFPDAFALLSTPLNFDFQVSRKNRNDLQLAINEDSIGELTYSDIIEAKTIPSPVTSDFISVQLRFDTNLCSFLRINLDGEQSRLADELVSMFTYLSNNKKTMLENQ